MMPVHHQAPWRIAGTRGDTFETAYVIKNADNHVVAVVDNAEDAALIAAAPQLLEACRLLINDDVPEWVQDKPDEIRAFAELAIQKTKRPTLHPN